MAEITSKPDHGVVLIEEGRAAEALQLYIDEIQEKLNGFLLGFQGVRLPSYTVATLPPVPEATAPSLIYVSDEAGGAVPAFSDGTNWRRFTDRVIIS